MLAVSQGPLSLPGGTPTLFPAVMLQTGIQLPWEMVKEGVERLREVGMVEWIYM